MFTSSTFEESYSVDYDELFVFVKPKNYSKRRSQILKVRKDQ